MEDGKICGPYKATKLWNQMVETFRNGIPLKRHRRHIKVYDNCFTGQEAVNWFQAVLQNGPYLGNDITREQTIQLLNKFLKAGVFQSINAAASNMHHQYVKEGDLYQLTNISSPRLPLTLRMQNIQSISRKKDWSSKPPYEISHTVVGLPASHMKSQEWSGKPSPHTLQNVHYCNDNNENIGSIFQQKIPIRKLTSPENPICDNGISGKNGQHYNQGFTVSPQEVKNDMHRMSGENGQHYNLGFTISPQEVKNGGHSSCKWPDTESRVSHRIEDIWKQVVVSRLQKLVPTLQTLIQIELDKIPSEWITQNATANTHHMAHFPQSLVAAFNCLLHWPKAVPNEILTAFKEHYFQLQEPLVTHKVEPLLCKAYLNITRGLVSVTLPPNSCFETAFTSDSPVTRIVPQRNVDTLHFSHAKPVTEKQSIQQSIKHEKSKRQIKMNKRRMSRTRANTTEGDKMYHIRNKSGGYVNPAAFEPEEELDYAAALESVYTLMRFSRRDESTNAVCNGADKSSESSSYYTAASSSSSAASSPRSSWDLGDSVYTQIEDSKEKAITSVMQLLLLCIPVNCRTQLRYLLHFMHYWMNTFSLRVQVDVVHIFTPTIMQGINNDDMDVSLAQRIVYFLVKNHDIVFSVPSNLESEVSERFGSLQLQNVSMTYCEQVSHQQFQEQKLTGSQLALSELLDQIIQDGKMSSKEKHKRLKLFKESYPHIYKRRFPDSTVETRVKKKLPGGGLLNIASLTRLKSLRV